MTTTFLKINDNAGKILLEINHKGEVIGSIEDASEAGKVFIESIRLHGKTLLERVAYLEKGLSEIAELNRPNPIATAQAYLKGIA